LPLFSLIDGLQITRRKLLFLSVAIFADLRETAFFRAINANDLVVGRAGKGSQRLYCLL
jgi:hypothetical protein